MIQDVTGTPRHDNELHEALEWVSRKLANPFPLTPDLIQYRVIKDALEELITHREFCIPDEDHF